MRAIRQARTAKRTERERSTLTGTEIATEAKVEANNSTAIGSGAKAMIANQIVLGTNEETVMVPGQLDVTDYALFNSDVSMNQMLEVVDLSVNGTLVVDGDITGNLIGNVDGIVGGTNPAAVTGTVITATNLNVGSGVSTSTNPLTIKTSATYKGLWLNNSSNNLIGKLAMNEAGGGYLDLYDGTSNPKINIL